MPPVARLAHRPRRAHAVTPPPRTASTRRAFPLVSLTPSLPPPPPHQASSAPASRPSSTASCGRKRAAAWPSSRTSWAKSASTRTWVRVCVLCGGGGGGGRLAVVWARMVARTDRGAPAVRMGRARARDAGSARPAGARAVWAARLLCCWRVPTRARRWSRSLSLPPPLPAATPAMGCAVQRANGGWRACARTGSQSKAGWLRILLPPLARPEPTDAASPPSC